MRRLLFAFSLLCVLGSPVQAASPSKGTQVMPGPRDQRVELILNGNVSTRQRIDVQFTGQRIPRTFARGNIGNVTGFHWFVSKHFALQTDHAEPQARKALELLEMAYPHWIDYVGNEPEDMRDTRIAVVYASSWEKIRDTVGEYGFLKSPVENGEQMFYNTAAYTHDGGTLYLLLHEGFHAFCDAFRGSYGSGWFGEGAAQDSASYVIQPDWSQLAVFAFDPGPGNRFRKSLEQWKKKVPSVEGFTRWGPNYNPGATIQHFFKDEPLRNQYWKIWAKEVHSPRWRERSGLKSSYERSDALVYSLFGSKDAFRREWTRWIKQTQPSTVASGRWKREGNAVHLREGEGSVVFDLPLGKKATFDATRLDFFPPEPSNLVGEVRRGGAEPSVGALLRIKGRGRSGVGLGVRGSQILKVMVEDGTKLHIEGKGLGVKATQLVLPPELAASASASKPQEVGLNVQLQANKLRIRLRSVADPAPLFDYALALPRGTVAKLRQRPVALIADSGSTDEMVAYFDDGRPSAASYRTPAPMNRWRNPGDGVFGRVVEAEWYLGKSAPSTLRKQRAQLHQAADKERQTQEGAMKQAVAAMPKLAAAVAKGSKPENVWALEALSGLNFATTWLLDKPDDGKVHFAATIRNPSAYPVEVALRGVPDDRRAATTESVTSVVVPAMSEKQVEMHLTRAAGKRQPFTIFTTAKFRWLGQEFELKRELLDQPWPGLTMAVEAKAKRYGASEVGPQVHLTADDDFSVEGKLLLSASPASAVEEANLLVPVRVPASARQVVEPKFRYRGGAVPLKIEVVGFFDIDGEKVRLAGQATSP